MAALAGKGGARKADVAATLKSKDGALMAMRLCLRSQQACIAAWLIGRPYSLKLAALQEAKKPSHAKQCTTMHTQGVSHRPKV